MILQEESGENAQNIFPQKELTVIAITWNLYASLPPQQSVKQLYRSSLLSPAPDMILMGTQQCERSLLASVCFESKLGWEEMIQSIFSQYTLLTSITMGGLHSSVLVKKKLRDYCAVENRAKLRAGYCGLMGNKGAISIEIFVLGQYFQFINCHLAPHQTQNEKRNETIQRILERIVQSDQKCQVIFLGDFNYRIDITKTQYQMMVKSNKRNTEEEIGYLNYFDKQQLSNQPALKKRFLANFQEGRVNFPPTYKLDISRNQYNASRIPGWTDRIFHRVRESPNQMILEGYNCEYDIMGCDHRPVIARYSKSLIPNQVYFKNNLIKIGRQSSCQII